MLMIKVYRVMLVNLDKNFDRNNLRKTKKKKSCCLCFDWFIPFKLMLSMLYDDIVDIVSYWDDGLVKLESESLFVTIMNGMRTLFFFFVEVVIKLLEVINRILTMTRNHFFFTVLICTKLKTLCQNMLFLVFSSCSYLVV